MSARNDTSAPRLAGLAKIGDERLVAESTRRLVDLRGGPRRIARGARRPSHVGRLGRLSQQRVHEALEAVEFVDAELQERDGQAVGIHAPHDPLDGHAPLLVGRRQLKLDLRPHRRARVRRPQPHLHAERAQGDDLPFPFEAGAPSHGDVPRDLHARIPAPLLRLNSPLALTDHAAFLRSGNGNEDATEGGAWEVIYLRRARARFWSGSGLEITSVTPRRRASSSWHGLTHPERMMTGSRRCHSRIARKTSIPSIPGITTSRKTASGGFCAMTRRPSSPLEATTTSWSSSLRASAMTSATSGSSSMTRILMLVSWL